MLAREVFVFTLRQDETNTVTFWNKDTAITDIQLEVSSDVVNSKIEVKTFNEKPEGVPNVIGDVYMYMSIDVSNLNQDNIESAKITFKVDKSWLQQNNYAYSDIVLYRYTSAWDTLQTTVLREDDNYVYFSAETPGFSTFAIGVVEKPVATEPPVVQPPVTPPKEEPPAEQPPAEEAPPAETKKPVDTMSLLLVAGLAALIVLALFFGRKKTKEQK